MSRAAHRLVAVLGFVLLLVLHHDWWRPQRAVVHLGWIPEELAWRLGWMALAFVYLLHFCRWVWTAPPGEPAADGPATPADDRDAARRASDAAGARPADAPADAAEREP